MRHRASWTTVLFLALFCAIPALSAFGAPSAADQPAPKVVFDLTVSLEWQPGTSDQLLKDLELAGCTPTRARDQYLDDLVDSLRRTSAYLYAYSEGQMALGKIAIYSGGEHWDDADIRILASNAYRPSAFPGGIVKEPLRYTSSPTKVTPVFYPGMIYLSRVWDGRGARCGPWSVQEGWRTIGHEWGHYALFLWDEYFNQQTLAEQYCTSTTLNLPHITANDPVISTTDSLMAYHYRADKLWLSDNPSPASCLNTPQMYVHGTSDWNTITRFYGVTPPVAPSPGPEFSGSPAEALFSATIIPPATPLDRSSAPVSLAALSDPWLVAQTYLIHPAVDTGLPLRIIGQGELLSKHSTAFWGAQKGDRALVFAQSWHTPQRFAFPKDYRTAPGLTIDTTNTINLEQSQWRPSLTITPQIRWDPQSFSQVIGLTVNLQDCALTTKRIQLVYCPAGGDCGTPVDVSDSGSGFQYTFPFPETPPATYGYIYARKLDTGEETATWYQLSGGVGPAHIDSHAPLLDGIINLDPAPSQPEPTVDSQVLYSPAQSCLPATRLSPQFIIVGTPILVQPVPANREVGGWGPNDPPLTVRLSYNQDLLDQLGLDERRLIVLRSERAKQAWVVVQPAGRSLALDWVTVTAQSFDGQGTIYALGYQLSTTSLPLVRR